MSAYKLTPAQARVVRFALGAAMSGGGGYTDREHELMEQALASLHAPVALTPAELGSIYEAQARLEVEWLAEGDDTPESRRKWRAFERMTLKVLGALR